MKVKRIIIPFITLVIMTSQLAGCATMNSDEMLKSMQESPDVSIEYAIPDEEQQSLDATQVIDIGDQQYVSDSDSEIGLLNEEKQELEELSHDELIAVFEGQYEISKEIDNSDSEETIQSELLMIEITAASMNRALPSNYEVQYREWRPSVISQASEVTLTFTEVNEQVWATGTVNLRSGPSTEDDKVGSLNKNQSVTRIGIGTGDYSSWSKVKLSDGSEVYVASNYLTTTKPSTGSNQQGGGNTQTPPQQGSQQQGGDQQQYDPSLDRGTTHDDGFGTYLTEEEAYTGTDDPYSGYGEVSIGYGGK